MKTPSKSHEDLLAPVRGGLFFLGSLLALFLAASVVCAQPPEQAPEQAPGQASTRAAEQPPEHPPSKSAEDLGPQGDFARHGERGRQPEAPLDLTGARRVVWSNSQGGVWSDASNWSGGALPGEDDIAVIAAAGNYEVELDGDAIVGALELAGEQGVRTLAVRRHTLKIRGSSRVGAGGVLHLDGGIVTGPGDLEIEGRLLWTGGSMSGSGTLRIARSGRLRVEGPNRKVLSLRALDNAGQAEWSGSGDWVLTFDAPVRNLAGGELVLSADALLDVYGPPGPVLENAGTVRKKAAGTVVFEPPFHNSGEVQVEAGALELLAGFTQTGGATEVAAGAAIRSPGGFDVEGGTVSGEGEFPRLAEVSPSSEPPG